MPIQLPITHILQVFDIRRAPCINHPEVRSMPVPAGGEVGLCLMDGHYVVVELTKIMVIDAAKNQKAECTFGWKKNILDFWSNLHSGDERRVVLTPVKPAVKQEVPPPSAA